MNGDQSLHQDDRGDKGPLDNSLRESALRNRFLSLREEELRHVPVFASLWGKRIPVQGRKGLWFAAATCVLIVVAAILLLRSWRPNREEVSMVSITEWKAPTDFLLETPGREILQTVPEIGKWQGYTAATPAMGDHLQVRKKALH